MRWGFAWRSERAASAGGWGTGSCHLNSFSYLAKVDRPMRVAFIIVHHHSHAEKGLDPSFHPNPPINLTEFLIKILYLSMIDDVLTDRLITTPLLVIIRFVL
jgi:hypothetical protein